MEATDIFENILKVIKSSNLNYHLEQTPFAARISLKKTAIKDMSGNPLKLSPPTNLEARGAEIEHLHREISVGREDDARMENLLTDKDYLIEAL